MILVLCRPVIHAERSSAGRSYAGSGQSLYLYTECLMVRGRSIMGGRVIVNLRLLATLGQGKKYLGAPVSWIPRHFGPRPFPTTPLSTAVELPISPRGGTAFLLYPSWRDLATLESGCTGLIPPVRSVLYDPGYYLITPGSAGNRRGDTAQPSQSGRGRRWWLGSAWLDPRKVSKAGRTVPERLAGDPFVPGVIAQRLAG